MVRLLGVALIGAGLVLALLGLRANDSTASAITRLFSGSPTREAVLLLAGAGAAILAGMLLVVVPVARRAGRAR